MSSQPLANKTALVTGGGTGIGQGIAWALAGAGCRVAVAGRREDKLLETVRGFKGEPGLVHHTVDVADHKSVEALFAWADKTLGRVDILVNNAGINIAKRKMGELSIEDWDKLLAVNASGVYYCIRAVLPQMRERKDGLIVNISSVAGKRASVLGGVAYSASKFAATALGMTAALEEGNHGIRITNVYPGEVETPILDQRPVPVSAEHRARILQPEDLGAAVLMVACLPPRAHVAEMIIKPTSQAYA
jgi:NAD(P)-dependent dehydrogenase (short-subunit alcohol dehydrogenase family)